MLVILNDNALKKMTSTLYISKISDAQTADKTAPMERKTKRARARQHGECELKEDGRITRQLPFQMGAKIATC